MNAETPLVKADQAKPRKSSDLSKSQLCQCGLRSCTFLGLLPPQGTGNCSYLLVHLVFIHVTNSLVQVLDMKLQGKKLGIETSILEKPPTPYEVLFPNSKRNQGEQ